MGAKEAEPAPAGTCPMMISMREMETLGLKTGSGLRETVEFKVFTRQEVLDQIAQVGFMCPFHEFRAEIAKMPAGGDILIVADPNEMFGENWLLCLTRRAFDSQMELINRREQDRLDALAAQEKEANAADANDVSKIVYEDRPMLLRPWTSVTARETHDDVEALSVVPSRPLITMSVTKMSDELNADYKFSDRDADQCFVEWRQHKDPNYELTRLEQDVGLQGTPPLVDGTTQTSWFRSVNSALQYEPIVMEPAQRQAEMDSDKIQAFLAHVLPRVERALQQNETLDVFLDPFAHLLEEEDASLGNKNNENVMRELKSFTDLVYSKNKTLPAVDWHPRRHGVVAVAAAANASFARRLDLLDTVESSFILIWNFVDLIHPQIMLESPQDVLSMRFSPAAPHLVAAGLYNGQVLVWDFSKAEHLLSKMKTTKTPSGPAAGTSASSSSKRVDDAHKQVPPVKPLFVSYIDVSHRRPVADLQWLPAGVEVNSRGHVVASSEADAGAVNQFVTIAADGQVSFWDLRFKDPKYRGMTRTKVDKAGTAGAKDGTTPDVHFVPIYSISLAKLDSPGELTLQTLWLEKTREETGPGSGDGGSGGVLPLTSKFYCGTEEGEFVYADWRPHAPAKGGNKGDDGGRGGDEGVEYVQWLCRDHSRPILGLCASPFFPSIFLTASESHFHLWNVSQQHEGGAKDDSSTASNGPIFVSPLTPSVITCVAFSPSRPGVIFLGKADGMLEVWDFLDQSHRSSLSIGVTACALTSIEFRPQLVPNPSGNSANATNSSGTGAGTGKGKATDAAGARGRTNAGQNAPANATTNIKQQLVAVGDQIGNLHILEVPRTLSRPTSGERAAMEAYFKRESERMKAARALKSGLSDAGAPSLRQNRGEDGAPPGTAAANNLSSMPGKEADPTRSAPAGADDDVFKQMENEFCRDMGLDTTVAEEIDSVMSAAGKLQVLKMGVSRRGSSLNASLKAKDVRIQLDEEFEKENGYSFDYVLVFQVHDEAAELSEQQKKFSMRSILQHVARGGIETKMFYSTDRGHVFCKLRATLERLSKEADRIDYKVEFDPTELRRVAETGYEEQNIKKIVIKDEHQISHRDPFQNIFAKFDVEPRLYPAYRKHGHKQIPFRGVDRIKLLLNIIKTKGEGGCGLNLSDLLRDKCLVAAFPLHEPAELNKLRDKWFSWKFAPWQQPLWDIKDYFGEKVGLYFAWLGHYTTWLIAPAIVGCLLFADVLVEDTADSALVPYFGLFMALWSIFYYEYWKRYNSALALEWGMSTFEEEEVERPDFEGQPTVSPIDGSEIRYFSPQTRFRRVMGSLFFISMLILLVVAVVAGIFVFRYAATSGKWKDMFTVNGTQLGGPAASTVNAIQIMVMNNVYSTVAAKLNQLENHRTDTEYEDHLIGKTFLFQFVNSYASLFYVAFIKTSVEGHESCKPEGHGCMDELMMSLGIIFILRLTSGNFFEAGLPWIMKKLKRNKKENSVYREPSAIEKQLELDVYDEKGTFDDYNEMIIQFGYVTLFVVSFPLAPAFALFNNFFEIRIDAHKLVNATRRPDPRGAQDIGTWGTIIDLMGSIAMVTNVALVCFTSRRTTTNLTDHERLWLFVCVEHGLILLKYVLMLVVDDEPHDVTLQKQRSSFIVNKIVHLIADDDDEEMAKGNQVRVDLTVFDEDI